MCGPHRRFAPLLSRTLRRIPQAVGAVATKQALQNQYSWGLKIGFGKPHTVNGQNVFPFDPQGLWM